MRFYLYLVYLPCLPKTQYSFTILSLRSFPCPCLQSYFLLSYLFSLFILSRIPVIWKFKSIHFHLFFFWCFGEFLTFALLTHQFDVLQCPICYSVFPLAFLIWQVWFSFPSNPPWSSWLFPQCQHGFSELWSCREHIFSISCSNIFHLEAIILVFKGSCFSILFCFKICNICW